MYGDRMQKCNCSHERQIRMPLQLVNGLSNEIETIVDKNRRPWLKREHVGKFLDQERILMSVKGLDDCEMPTRRAVKPGPKDQQNKTDIFLLKQGLLYVINKSRKPTPNLINLTKYLGIQFHKNQWLCKEQDTLRQVLQVFNGDEMIHQFSVRIYRIDIYFLEYKLAIECDEIDHCDRDIRYEAERQKHIEELLNCIFVRFNPGAKDFHILEVVSKVFAQIKSFFQKKL